MPDETMTKPPPGREGPQDIHRLIGRARAHQLVGELNEAIEGFAAAIDAAKACGDQAGEAEALRRLGIVHRLRSEMSVAREFCRRSYELSLRTNRSDLAAEALNCLAGFHFETGDLASACEYYQRALELGGQDASLAARVQQNLGIIASVRGTSDLALVHYRKALEAYQRLDDPRGCAMVYHNLGTVSADAREWADAARYFELSAQHATAAGDVHQIALSRLGHAKVRLGAGQLQEAREQVEAALEIFERLDNRGGKAEAYRLLGAVFRRMGRHALAESRLHSAIDIAESVGSALSEGEACHELALLYEATGQRQEAFRLLARARNALVRIGAATELREVETSRSRLEMAA